MRGHLRRGREVQPVAIGRLERFVADFAMGRGWDEAPRSHRRRTKRAAIIGSGPAGLACAGDLAKRGVQVTVFEALHVAGGVLKYGIPEFRLPDLIIDAEIENLRKLGVDIRLDTVIGKLFTIPQLLNEMGYDTVFIATGAGSPKFMGIPGEAFNGVFSANEFLTRVNLMRGYRQPIYDTPVGMGKHVAVVGAGNTAMDSARVSLRMGAEKVHIIYRRCRRECPARAEELEHAIQEGVEFHWLTNPVAILGDASGWVTGFACQKMELGEPDASGRRRPVSKPGTEFPMEVDTVIYALGTSANPIIAQTTPGLKTNAGATSRSRRSTGMTSLPGVFAGGDIVTGAATVILAMGAGRRAANGMLNYMGSGVQDVEEPMPSFCPNCHGVLEQDEICCAQVAYTWKCKNCHKVATGFAVPYGKCFLCGGDLELITDRNLGDPMRFAVIREAVQLEINSHLFYKLARERTTNAQMRVIFEQLFENELDHIHLLEERYHAHLDRSVLELKPDAEQLLANWLFRDIDLADEAAAPALYDMAIAMEKRTRDYFRNRATELPDGLEKELCLELAAEEEEHVAMLETEQAQFTEKP